MKSHEIVTPQAVVSTAVPVPPPQAGQTNPIPAPASQGTQPTQGTQVAVEGMLLEDFAAYLKGITPGQYFEACVRRCSNMTSPSEMELATLIAGYPGLYKVGECTYKVEANGVATEYSLTQLGMLVDAMLSLTRLPERRRKPWLSSTRLRGVRSLVIPALREAKLHPKGSLRVPDGVVYIPERSPVPGEGHLWCTTYNPAPSYDDWEQLVVEWMSGNVEMAHWLQVVYGAALLGYGGDLRLMAMHLGDGSNGKSLYHRVIEKAMGEYAAVVPMASLLAPTYVRDGASHTADLASLEGRRMISASETDIGKRLRADRIKSMTGGDRIAVRGAYERSMHTIQCVGLISISTNHMPRAEWAEEALASRIHVVEWKQRYDHDPEATERILSLGPQALAWMIEGARLYVEAGMKLPPFPGLPACLLAERRGGMVETLDTWATRHIVPDPNGRVRTEDILLKAAEAGVPLPSSTRRGNETVLGGTLRSMGFQPVHSKFGRYWLVRILDNDGDEEASTA